MRKFICYIILCVLVSGCSSLKLFSKKSTQPNLRKSINVITLSKHDAIRKAQDFLREQDFDNEFIVSKPHKISRLELQETYPRWVWRIHFPHKNRSFWMFWKKSPLAVLVDASSGEIMHWGRR